MEQVKRTCRRERKKNKKKRCVRLKNLMINKNKKKVNDGR